MKNILVPTDFSENSENAIVYALEIANKTGATITLLNVTHIPSGSYTMHRNIRGILTEDSIKSLTDLKNKIKINAAAKDVEINTVSRYGDLVIQTNKIVEETRTDLIVMGTQGASGVEEIFFGSNTAKIIEHILHCPVLAIPEKAKFHGINKIVFATKYAGYNVEAVKELTTIASLFNASIHILHIITEKEEKASEISKQFQKKITEEVPNYTFTFHEIENKDVLEGLNDFIVKENIDMMAMVARKKGFFESFYTRSIVKTVAFHTTVPLIAFHDK